MINTKRLPVLNFILLLAVISILIVNYIKPKQHNKLVYIDNIQLFNGFNMVKDIKALEEPKIKKQTRILDSLYTIYNAKSNKEKNQVYTKQLQQQIATKSKQLQELKDIYSRNLNTNVWKRLNEYIEIFATQNGYNIVLGTNGSGNVMYAKTSINITNEILEFSNKKYEGK
ncbi:OmpH family outer membrane protein [Hyunsoonleella pacifica]|uniref:OmpH family outer membrane protein n=1 Tax=Hyunsoonleella pacifica TaxID=1080224 RepID=A0A4Q9FJS6_9FLAO|nr:OmpH family outer membrane protein [Hyunsoonleella pacifica]TBN11957.1 OmpH family outer membrane protein [Hyunsoonleella pacifica]GGD07600.1 OmpH family outer membrane protein [Hyunsoonleella pacifica]